MVSSAALRAALLVVGCAATITAVAAHRQQHRFRVAFSEAFREAFREAPNDDSDVEKRILHDADERIMQGTLNNTGASIIASGASTQCKVGGVAVHEMELSNASDASTITCTVPKSMLRIPDRPPPGGGGGGGGGGSRDLQALLRSGPVIAAFCRPSSTLCTVEFDRAAAAADVKKYNQYLTDTFGVATTALSRVSTEGTMYVDIPNVPPTARAKRQTIAADDGGTGAKRILAYKYVGKAATESPLDLWRSGGRNADDDLALNASDGTTSYCSELLGEAAWEGLAFSHVVLEVRRGPQTLSSFRFRATKDRLAWFHPMHLVSARFGPDLEEAPLEFASRRFARFRPDDASGDRLFWTIIDDYAPGEGSATLAPECTSQPVVYLAVPHKATACVLHERLQGRIVAAQDVDDPASFEDAVHPATHIVAWLVVPTTDEPPAAKSSAKAEYQGQLQPRPIAPSFMEQKAPPNPFDVAAKKPTKDAPVVLCGYASGGPCAQPSAALAWSLALDGGAGAYSRADLTERLSANRSSVLASIASGAPAQATLPTLNFIRFHKSYRVVLFGQGHDFSADAAYVAVLQDASVMATYGYAAAPPAKADAAGTVRFAGGRTATLRRAGNVADSGDGAFLDVCIDGEMEGTVRSIIVERVTDVPVQASRKCAADASAAFETLLHVGSYDSSKAQVDVLENGFDVASLRSFRVAEGYTLTLFSRPGMADTPIGVHVGPEGVCVRDGDVVRSIKIIRSK